MTTKIINAIIRLIIMLPFLVPAFLLSMIAGVIGGTTWKVIFAVKQHGGGDPLMRMSFTVRENEQTPSEGDSE